MKTKCSYSDYLKTISNDKLFKLWNLFCENNDDYINQIYDMTPGKQSYILPYNGLVMLFQNYEEHNNTNYDEECVYWTFDNKKFNRFANLTDDESPIDFKKLSKWIIENNLYEKFDLDKPEN